MEQARRILRESRETLTEGFGFDNQREVCEQFEAKHNLLMVKEHQLVENSTTWNRDRFEAIIDEAIMEKDETPWFILPRVDRFARNGEAAGYYLGLLRRNKVKLAFAQEDIIVSDEASAMQVLMFHIHSFKADQDGKQIKANMLGGRDRLGSDRHELPNGMAVWPFDYVSKRLYGVMSTGKPTLNPQKTAWVRKWVSWILNDGIGESEICRRMEEAGISAPKGGKKWSPSTIRRILRSKELIGVFEWKGKVIYEEKGETVLTMEQFDALQRRLDEVRETSYYNAAKLDYPPLRGMVFCQCGHRMGGVPMHGYGYYRCPACYKPLVNAQWLWKQIEGEIKSGLLREDRLIPAMKSQFDDNERISNLEKDIEDTDHQIKEWDDAEDKAFRLALITNYPEAKLQQRLKEINEARTKAMKQKEEITNQLTVLKEKMIDEEGITRFCQLVASNINNLNKQQWEMLLKILKLKITVYGKDLITVNVALPPILAEVESKNEFSRL